MKRKYKKLSQYKVLLLLSFMFMAISCNDVSNKDDTNNPDAESQTDLESDTDSEIDTDQSDTSADSDAQTTRTFLLGITGWPYDATIEAVEDTYDKVLANADVVTQHLMGGVPWPEALSETPYHPAVEAEICTRLKLTYPEYTIEQDEIGRCYAPNNASKKPIFLAADSLNSGREDLAGYWSEEENQSLSDLSEWEYAKFSDENTSAAFINWSKDLISRFKPSLFNYGSEMSELLFTNPEGFDDFVVFASKIYPEIKQAYPDLPIMVSFALKHPDSEQSALMQQRLPEILPYVDMVGISVYPYAFFGHADAGDPGNLPQKWLSQVLPMALDKPLAITETGWIAQDLAIEQWGLDVQSTPLWQQAFLQTCFESANALGIVYIGWFAMLDYEPLWNAIGQDPIAAIWKDTGLYDDNQQPRPALELWQKWRNRPVEM